MRPRFRRWILLSLALSTTVGLSMGGTAKAEAGAWLGATSVPATTGNPDNPAVAVAANGDTVIAWQDSVSRIVVAVRPAGQSGFGTPVVFDDNAYEPKPPVVAIDARGDAIVAWSREAAGTNEFEMRTAYRPAGGQFTAGTDETVPNSLGVPEIPAVSFFADGTALLAWTNGRGVSYSQRPPGAQSQFAPATLYTLPSSTVAVEDGETVPWHFTPGSGGSRVLAWDEQTTTYPDTNTTNVTDKLVTGQFAPDGSLQVTPVPGATATDSRTSPPNTISGTVLAGWSSASDDAGDTLVVWGSDDPSYSHHVGPLKASYRPAGGAFPSVPDTIAADPVQISGLTTAVLPSGTALLAGQWEASGVQYLQKGRNDAAFATTPEEIPDATGPVLAAGQSQAFLTYVIGTGTYVSVAGDGQTFRPASEFSAPDSQNSPALATDGQDDAAVDWLVSPHADGSEGLGELGVATYDNGPRGLTLSAPATATAGQPVQFTAQAFDPFSPVTLQWRFSDGGGINGAAVSHAWATPGQATATVTAVDGAGLSSDPQTASLSIAPGPAIPTASPQSPSGSMAVGAGQTGPARSALRITLRGSTIVVDRGRARATVKATCGGASVRPCTFTGGLVATRWTQVQGERVLTVTRTRLASVTGILRGTRSGDLTVRLTGVGQRTLRRGRAARVVLTGTLSARTGKPTRVLQFVTLRRRR